MTPTRSDALRGHAAMLLFSALVAGSFSLGVQAANIVEPMALNFARFGIAVAIIGTLAFTSPGVKLSHFRAPWRFGVLGALFGFYFVMMFEGLKTAQPVSASAVFTLTPVISALFGWMLMKQKTTGVMALALAIGAAGAIWVIFGGDVDAILGFRVGWGETLYFIGCVSHALYTPMLRKLHRGEPGLVYTLGVMTAMVLMLGIVGFGQITSTAWLDLPAIAVITIVYLAIFASAVTFLCLQYASLRLPSAKVMAYTYLTPSWVILSEGALGHGWPPAAVLGGVLATMLALGLLLQKDG